jgi:glutathione S-transferase
VSHDELYAKPPWFLELNPAGLIPVIAWQQQQQQEEQEEAGCGRNAATAAACAIPGVVSITESLVCNEFLEDACPSPAVSKDMPADS